MKKSTIIIALILTACFTNLLYGQKLKKLVNPVFVFNNGLNKKEAPTLSFEDQAILIKKLGFDGVEHRETKGLLEIMDAFESQGLKIYTDYLSIDIDKQEPYQPEWKDVIPKLKGSEIILWVHIHSKNYQPSDEAADKIIVPILQELADYAKPYGVRIAIYHHVNFLAEKAEDSYRLAQKANRNNVGSVFNLCHFLKTDSSDNLAEVINLTLPKLFSVSISGADMGDTKNMGWDRLIQPLGKGSFDVYRLVELLADKGFEGPIGIQCYNLKGSPEVYLKESSDAIQNFKQKYSMHSNSLTKQEQYDGWTLLFDGSSVEGWIGVNQKTFPEKGWKIENGALISSAEDGAESGNGGDIITKKQYGNFILNWEWKIISKGGNSGLKYFVQEKIG